MVVSIILDVGSTLGDCEPVVDKAVDGTIVDTSVTVAGMSLRVADVSLLVTVTEAVRLSVNNVSGTVAVVEGVSLPVGDMTVAFTEAA